MGGQYSVKETKEVVSLGAACIKAFDNAYEDGKINLNDLVHLVPVGIKVPDAVNNVGLCPKELGELDKEDQAELEEHVKKEMGDSYYEGIGEEVLLAGIHIAKALAMIKHPPIKE